MSTHTSVGDEKRIAWLYSYRNLLRDVVAQVAVVLSRDETLVAHPGVIEHLGDVSGTGVAYEGNDSLGGGLLSAVAKRCSNQET